MTMNSNPGIYIPRVYANITWRRVKDVFEEIFGVGTIGRVDVVKNNSRDLEQGSAPEYNRVFVHFKYWPKEHNKLREKLVAGDTLKIVYEDPWYWKCMLNKYPRTLDKDGTRRPQKAPYVEVDNSKSSAPHPSPVKRSISPPRIRRQDAAKAGPTPSNSYAALAAAEEDGVAMDEEH